MKAKFLEIKQLCERKVGCEIGNLIKEIIFSIMFLCVENAIVETSFTIDGEDSVAANEEEI